MDAADLAALAREREARQRPAAAAAAASAPLPQSWAKKPSPARPTPASNLHSAHRTIRLARALGLAAIFLAILMIVLGFGWRVVAVFFAFGVICARGGAPVLHGALPPTLIESGAKVPTATEVQAAAAAGLFCIDGVKSLGESFAAEYALALESLAFVCTYGKKNCLTNDMYSGELSLGKICGLVWGKLREGVIRC
jgi:hypothetical protein